MRLRYLLVCSVALVAQTLFAQTIDSSIYVDTAANLSALAVAPDGTVIVAGNTRVGALTTTVSSLPASGLNDLFIQRYSPDLTQLLTSVRLGGARGQSISAMALDSEGNIYLAGNSGGDFPGTEVSPQPTLFVAKINAAADTLVWSTLLRVLAVTDLTVDAQGRVNITGTAGDLLPVTADAVQPVMRQALCAPSRVGLGPCPDAFLTRLNATDGSLVYGTYYGGGGDGTQGSGGDAGYTVRTGADNTTYVGGMTSSIDFPVTIGPIQKQGMADAFVLALSANGRDTRYSRLLGGAEMEAITDIKAAADGSVTVLGASGGSGGVGTTFGLSLNEKRSFLTTIDPSGIAAPLREIGLSSRLLTQSGQTVIAGPGYALDANLRQCFGTTYFSSLGNTGAVQPRGYAVGLGPLMAEGAAGAIYLAGNVIGPNYELGFRLTRLRLAENPSTFVSCVANAASLRINSDDLGVPIVSPGEIVTITGGGLGPENGVSAALVDGRFPASLAGTRVLVNGVPAPVLYVQDRQINAIIPFSLVVTNVKLVVERNGIAQPAVDMHARSTAPGVFTASQDGRGQVIAANQDGSLNSAENPARAGSIITFYATGLGQTHPPLADGAITPLDGARPALTEMEIFIGPRRAMIEYAGPAPGLVAGAFQLNVRIPEELFSSNHAVVFTVAGVASNQFATVAVQAR